MTNDILTALMPFGSLDIGTANSVMDEANVLDSDVADFIHEYYDGAENISILDADIVALTYEYILSQVRTEIEEATGKDILNDLDDTVYVAGNYCATSFDYTDRAKEETLELAKQVEEPSKTLQWFIGRID